jgi:ArsR family transcriptional regulator
MKRELIEQISKALADQTRLRILEAISSSGKMNCGQLVSMRGVTPATVSHHLKILHRAGLIECRKKGQFVYSEAKPQRLNEYAEAVAAMTLKAKKKPAGNSSRARARATG